MDALVIGAAACVWDDFALLEKLYGGLDHFTTFAANDGGVLWRGRLDHWCTLHTDELPEREERRRENGYPDGYTSWGITGKVDKVLPQDWQIGGGSSGLLGAARGVRGELPGRGQDHPGRCAVRRPGLRGDAHAPRRWAVAVRPELSGGLAAAGAQA